MEKFLSVDRIEGNTAVLIDDDENIININLCEVDFKLEEGFVLRVENNKFFRDIDEENARKKALLELTKKLFKK